MSSYISVQEADQLLQFHDNAELWNSLSEEEKEYRLRKATREIDKLKNILVGLKPTGQELEFPRVGQTEVPFPIKEATAEIAIHSVKSKNNNKHIEAQRNGIQSVNIEGLSFTYTGAGAKANVETIPPEAWELLRDFIESSGNFGGC